MKEKSPATVKIAIALLCFKIFVVVSLIIIYASIMDTNASDPPYQRGIYDGFNNVFGLDPNSPAENLGYLIGYLMIPSAVTIGSIIAIMSRKFVIAVVFVGLEIAFGFGSGAFPVLPVGVMLLICLNPARAYLQRKVNPTQLPGQDINESTNE